MGLDETSKGQPGPRRSWPRFLAWSKRGRRGRRDGLADWRARACRRRTPRDANAERVRPRLARVPGFRVSSSRPTGTIVREFRPISSCVCESRARILHLCSFDGLRGLGCTRPAIGVACGSVLELGDELVQLAVELRKAERDGSVELTRDDYIAGHGIQSETHDTVPG